MTWQSMDTAPKDGTRFIAKEVRYGRRLQRITWWGKTSHVPMYGWCHGRVENTDLWEPTSWRPIHAGGKE